MTAERQRQFAETMEPFGGCAAGDAIALGYPMSGGLFFPIRDGAVILKRRELYPTPGRWMVCGMAIMPATQVSNYPGFGHAQGMGYQYIATRCEGNGYESEASPPIRVDFDLGGDLITPAMPAWPVDLSVVPTAGGAFTVRWRYDPWGEGAPPTDFAVYGGPTAAAVNYSTPLGTVTYDPGLAMHEFTISGFSEGQSAVFAVRARNSSGVAEANTYKTRTVYAKADGPAAATIQIATTAHRRG